MSSLASVKEICLVAHWFLRRNMTAGIMPSQRSVISVDPLLDKINHVVPQTLIAIRNCVIEISPEPFSQKSVDVIL